MRNRAKHGFTLVELLVVIGIIAVLVAMLLPALNKAQQAAQKTQCMSNLRQCAMAFQQYASDNQQKLIVWASWGGSISSWPARMYGYDWWGNWTGRCYLTESGVRFCPSNQYSGADAIAQDIVSIHVKYQTTNMNSAYAGGWAGSNFGYGVDTGSPVTEPTPSTAPGVDPYALGNYAMNNVFETIYTDMNAAPAWNVDYPFFFVQNLSCLRQTVGQNYYSAPDDTVLLGDSVYATYNDNGFNMWHCAANSLRNNMFYGCCILLAHRNLANVAFYDGHVESLSDQDLRYNVGNHFKNVALPSGVIESLP